MPSPQYQLIQRADQLEDCLDELEQFSTFYLDTEFESSKRGTSLCLIQVRADKKNYLIDPQANLPLRDLGAVLGAKDTEWVLHAGLQDVELLSNALDIPLPDYLFDTQIAWALMTAEPSVSLAYLQFKVEGLRTSKAHQADDWVRRPLPASQLSYAASDVEYLPAIPTALKAQAKELGRLPFIYKASADSLDPVREPPAPLVLSSFRNAWQLAPQKQAALLALISWYNSQPLETRKNLPDNKVLLSVASRLPERQSDLDRIKGVGRSMSQQYGREIIELMHEAARNADEREFQLLDPPAYATFEEIRLEGWLTQMRTQLSIELQFAPEYVLPGRLTKRMKAAALSQGLEGVFESLVGWRQSLLKEPIAEFAERVPFPEI